MPGAHRVVRVGDVNQLGADLGRFGDQRHGVFVIVLIGNGFQHAPKARDVIVEGRIRALRGHHRVARSNEQSHQIAKDPVDPFAYQNILGRDAAVMGQSVAQIEIFRVAIHPDITYRSLHRSNGVGRGAERVLVRPKARRKITPTGAFLRFGADKRHGCGKAFGKRGQAGMGLGHMLVRAGRAEVGKVEIRRIVIS